VLARDKRRVRARDESLGRPVEEAPAKKKKRGSEESG
jgi:hypothetical protein